MINYQRKDMEWEFANAVRDMVKIASKGDISKSTYRNILRLGGELYPDLLGSEDSILKQSEESETAKLYRQEAAVMSDRDGVDISPIELLEKDLYRTEALISHANDQRRRQNEIDKLRRKRDQLSRAKEELSPVSRSENQIIFQDANCNEDRLPVISDRVDRKDYQLPDNKVLRVRVFHPEKAEHISGSDILYEMHDIQNERVNIASIQYKVWEDKTMYLSDPRMHRQLQRMKNMFCEKGICKPGSTDSKYRFPFCSAFLRPTDKLQKVKSKLRTSGEHLPICLIDDYCTNGPRGAKQLTYEGIRDVSLSHGVFDLLFSKGKIGSRLLTYGELDSLYSEVVSDNTRVLIHAQEFDADSAF